MKFKSRTAGSPNRSTIFGVSVGIVASFLISLLLMTGLTSLVVNGQVGESTAGVCILLIRVIAVLAGVLIGASLAKEKCVVTAGAIALGYLLLLTGLGIVVYDGSFKGFGFSAISVAMGGALGCVIRLKSQNKSYRKKKIRV